ncbi:MAG: carbohydrate ABC transporter permease [Oscillospiraceae bacterium]|jgi:putative aldouronate transport system permease protein|nr:carbohydrate ABC transporter permease [Oscillospiraceae bacterium]
MTDTVNNRKPRRTGALLRSRRQGDLLFDVVNLSVLAALTALFFYPMYMVFIASFSSPTMLFNGKVMFLPRGSNIDGFRRVMNMPELWRGYLNSIYYTIVGTAVNLAITTTGAFALSRKRFWLKTPLSIMVMVTMFFGGGMIPSYLLVRDLRLINTVWALVLPGAVSTWNLIISRAFLGMTISDELQDAALIDGCGHIRFFLSIVLPLSSTLVAILGMYYGVAHWNAYWNALLYMTNKDRYPLQLVLRNILRMAQIAIEEAKMGNNELIRNVDELYQRSESMKYIIVVAAVLPIMIVFPFIEKYFVKGVMIGSIKG